MDGLQIPNNPTLCKLLITMKHIVGARHRPPPSDVDFATGIKMTVEEVAQ